MNDRIKYFLAGASSVLSLFPAVPSFAGRTPISDDNQAMACDWKNVGDDLRTAQDRHGKQKTPK